MKNINVIGGSGFIGTRLVRLLSGFNVKILDINPSIQFPTKFVYTDIRSIDDLDNNLCESSIIINLAAEHHDNVKPKILYDEVNIGGAINICEVARRKNIKMIIFTSSVAVYGLPSTETDESGVINPFNDYGRTKWEAEKVYRKWQSEDPINRVLVIVRPTVIFGEGNRGNVYNLLKQIASRRFVMIGKGLNRKSMAYVENVASFLEYSLSFNPGIHTFNYVDKPDFAMYQLVAHVKKLLGQSSDKNIYIPFWLGLFIGNLFDVISFLMDKKFTISAIRVKKFCANSVYSSAIKKLSFVPPVMLSDAIEKTIKHEFIERSENEQIFYTH